MFTSILLQTPHWVWGLLAALTVIGFKQTLPRRRSLRSSTSLPLLMVFLSLYGVASAFSSQPLALIAWAVAGPSRCCWRRPCACGVGFAGCRKNAAC